MPGSVNQKRGPSDLDIRNSFSAGVTYDIPTPKINAFTNAILRGWSAENFIRARSASPVGISYSRNTFSQTNIIIRFSVEVTLSACRRLTTYTADRKRCRALSSAESIILIQSAP